MKNVRRWFLFDEDHLAGNIRWEKYPYGAYFLWAIFSIVLIIVILCFKLVIPGFSVIIYFGMFVILHLAGRKYIGLSLNKPDPSDNEIARMWLERLKKFGNHNEQFDQIAIAKKILRKLFLVRICVLITGATMFFLLFWSVFRN